MSAVDIVVWIELVDEIIKNQPETEFWDAYEEAN